ncbi:MAG: hypothetical protein FWB80_00045 [Defluviitaleaceae bacterium]|nr:hypothetical protein [Defluviitaleaceae bacterium]
MKAIECVKTAVEKEYTRAAEKFGATNNSPHESYAVILEKHEEAANKMLVFEHTLQQFWDDVKNNNTMSAKSFAESMMYQAESIIAEWIQVAAMCKKAALSFEKQVIYYASGCGMEAPGKGHSPPVLDEGSKLK